MTPKLAALLILTACLPLFQNCGPAAVHLDDQGKPRVSEASLKALATEIEEAAILTCTGTWDCESMPVGAKICGGPTHYQIYSTSETDVGRLQSLISEYTTLMREHNAADPGLNGDCLFVMPPQLECLQNRCTKVDASGL